MVVNQRKNLSQVVADDLLDRITAGEFEVGDRLPTEQGLMETYNVGRNVVREAIRQLVALEILDVRPGRGAIVVGIRSNGVLDSRVVSALLADQTVEDLYQFRLLVEVEIAARAAERGTPETVAAVREALASYRQRLREGLPVFRADVEFHRSIAVASGNEVFVRVLDALADLLEASRKRTDAVPDAPETALSEHEAILNAISERNVSEAREAMRNHIVTAIDVVRSLGAGSEA